VSAPVPVLVTERALHRHGDSNRPPRECAELVLRDVHDARVIQRDLREGRLVPRPGVRAWVTWR
jgi:hypothetical protein